jgi:hypothetical protein
MRKTKANFFSGRGAVSCLLCCLIAWPAAAQAAKILYRFKSWDGPPVRVFVTRPTDLAPDRPVVFVMHGDERNAIDYRDSWHNLAYEYEFLLVVPEFNERRFPGARNYELGGVFDKQGQARPESEWTYSAIEAIFDSLHERFGSTAKTYSLYGDHEGAQFVQRFLFHVPAARVDHVVAADAGWYLMPDFGVAWPYGLEGSAVDEARLAAALRMPLTLLLSADAAGPDPWLRKTPEAMAQGADRLARGRAFFTASAEAAARLDAPFNWSLETVDGEGSARELLAPAAVRLLLGN